MGVPTYAPGLVFQTRLRVTSRLNSRAVSLPRSVVAALSCSVNVSDVACVPEQILRIATNLQSDHGS